MGAAKDNLTGFWRKKCVISFYLSILVMCVHCYSISTYFRDSSETAPHFVRFFDLFFRDALPLVAVPLFFVISGAAYFRDYAHGDYLRKTKRRIRTLLIPYLIWNGIGMLFYIVTSYSFLSRYIIGRPLFKLTPWNIFLSLFHYECNIPFWYIFALLCYTVAGPVIELVIRNKYIGIFAIAATVILLQFGIELPSSVIFKPNSIVFYLTGCLIGKHFIPWFTSRASRGKAFCYLMVFLGTLVYFTFRAYAVLGDIAALDAAMLLVGAISFWFAFDLVIERIPIRKYHDHSFLIYAAHLNILAVYVKLLYFILPKNPYMCITNYILAVTLTALTIILFSNILKRWFPRIYSILSGQR